MHFANYACATGGLFHDLPLMYSYLFFLHIQTTAAIVHAHKTVISTPATANIRMASLVCSSAQSVSPPSIVLFDTMDISPLKCDACTELQFTRHKQNVIYVLQRQRDETWRAPRRHRGPPHRTVPKIEIY